MNFRVDPPSLKALEWNKIQNWFSEYLCSEGAKETFMQIPFTSELKTLEDRQNQTQAGKSLQLIDPSFRIRIGLRELRNPFFALSLLEKGSVLTPSGFLEIRKVADCVVEAKMVFSGATTSGGDSAESGLTSTAVDPLRALIEKMTDLSRVARMINRVVEDWTPEGDSEVLTPENQDQNVGRVKDGASSTLANLRTQEKKLKVEIKARLKKIMESTNRDGKLQDKWMDIRSGRYVIPIKDEFQNHVEGSVMESSVSGATVFIEPKAVMESTNLLRKIQLQIEVEVQRILTKLSEDIKPFKGDLVHCHNQLVELDIWIGKGVFAIEAGLSRPTIVSEAQMELQDCFHPILLKMLPPGKCVKNDFSFSEHQHGLLLSGPNSGGKTVLMKAVGLCQLFLAYGFHIPARENSQIHPFKSIFCDLGDHQSIEDNLSSFTGRIKNLKMILDNASEGSLILIDEILAATDPDEASALAQAVLEDLISKRARMILTTHFEKLKQYAASDTDLMNGSMEFDQRTLSPTFKFNLGIPGRSMALEIAARFGIPNRLVLRANELLGKLHEESGDLIGSLNCQLQNLENQKQELLKRTLDAEESKRKFDSELASLKQNKTSLVKIERENLARVLKKAQAEIDKVIEKSSKKQALRELNKVEKSVLEELNPFDSTAKSNDSKIRGLEVKDWGTVKLPARVYLISSQIEMDLIEVNTKNNSAILAQGFIKKKSSLDDLRLLKSQSPLRASAGSFSVQSESLESINLTLDLRGFRVEEAQSELEIYLDSSHANGLERVKIIHGHGDGAIKSLVRNYLKRVRFVKSFSPAHHKDGGDGSTIVLLK